jgi:3-oxoadipate enol-lactonase
VAFVVGRNDCVVIDPVCSKAPGRQFGRQSLGGNDKRCLSLGRLLLCFAFDDGGLARGPEYTRQTHQTAQDTEMDFQNFDIDGFQIAFRDSGPSDRPTVVFAHAMSFDQTIWDGVISRLSSDFRLVTYDHRGHGGSGVPPAPYLLEDYTSDAGRLLDYLGIKRCVFVGVSFGGLVAQGLAAQRPDVVQKLVLSNTATKIGTLDFWLQSADNAKTYGFTSEDVDRGFERLFSSAFRERNDLQYLKDRRLRLAVEGYVGCCNAIGHADLATGTSKLEQPTLVIGSDADLVTPQQVVEALTEIIPVSQFRLIRGSGHLPCIENPTAFAALLTEFLR